MKKQLIQHHYTECGLPYIWIECFFVRDDAGEDTFIIPNIRRLHKLIAQTVVMSPRALNGAEIRFLRGEMGLMPEEFARLVRRSEATVARWESGQSVPDSAVDVLIRFIAKNKLKLDIDLAKCIGEWESIAAAKRKTGKRIRITATRQGEYRLAA